MFDRSRDAQPGRQSENVGRWVMKMNSLSVSPARSSASVVYRKPLWSQSWEASTEFR